MEEIDINVFNEWNFHFDVRDRDFWEIEHKRCHYCKVYIDRAYSYIIECLKEANLLDENYEQVCCYCKVLKEYGLLDLYKDMSTFLYDKENDVLIIEFSFRERINSIRLENSKSIIWHRLYFKIHDYSKVKWG